MAINGHGKVRGTSSKYDRGLNVLEQYDLVSENTYRGRGTLLCQTQQGLKMIKPYTGSIRRLEKINQLLEHLQKCGHENLDMVIKNKDGELVSTDKEGLTYIVKNWRDGRECDVRQETDVIKCVEKLAGIHKDMQTFKFEEEGIEREHLFEEYEKHNRQMKKMRTYIRSRKQKNMFEYQYLESVSRYLAYGERAIAGIKEIDVKKTESICHGMCNQHNFLVTGENITLVNFDHFFIGNHMADVAQFLRKIMEKYNWNVSLGHYMLESYERICPMNEDDKKLLAIRMAYPEKYWKVANCYYNNNKSFLPEKNLDKLNNIIHQEHKWLDFLDSVFFIS